MKYDELPNIVVTDVVSAYVSHTQKSSQLREPVKNDCWLLCLKFEGKTFYRIGEEVHLSDINNAILIPPGCRYKFYCAEEGRIVSIYFKTSKKWTADEIYVLNVTDNEKTLMAFFDVAESKRKNKSGVETMLCFYRLLKMLFENNIKNRYFPSTSKEKIQPAITYIEQYYDAKITNELLSQVCGLSTQHFRKLFAQIYGIPPIAYVLRYRLTKAAKLLREDNGLSVVQVAQAVGIPDAYYFSKAFKKYMGISPKKYSSVKTPPNKGENPFGKI